jgi:hypothetical protein
MIEVMDLSETGKGARGSSWNTILKNLKQYEAILNKSASKEDKLHRLAKISSLIQAYLSNKKHQERNKEGAGDWNLSDLREHPDTAPEKGAPSRYFSGRSTEKEYNRKVALRYGLLRELEPRIRSEFEQLKSPSASAEQNFKSKKKEWRGGSVNSVDLIIGGSREMVFKAEVPHMTDLNQSANAVASYRLDQALHAGGVTNHEEFAVRTDTDDRTGFPAVMGTVQERIHGESLQGALQKGHLKDIDFTSNDVQQTMNRLQLLDLISGQTDRHNANVMFDKEHGRMVGIDSDRSFSRSSGINNLHLGPHSMGVPELIDGELGENILKMDDKALRQVVAATMPDMVSEETVQACTNRLHLLQAELRQRQQDGKFVKSWNKQTYLEQLKDWDPDKKGHNRVSSAMYMWLILWLRQRVKVYNDHKSQLKPILVQALKTGAGDPGALENAIDAMQACYQTGASSQAGTDLTKDADYLEFEKGWVVRTLEHLIRSPGSAVEPSFDAWNRLNQARAASGDD